MKNSQSAFSQGLPGVITATKSDRPSSGDLLA